MQCQQNGEDRNPPRDGNPENPDPLEPQTRGSDGRRYPGLVLSGLVTLIGVGTVGTAVVTPTSRAATVAIVGLGAAVAIAGGYNTLRQAIDVRPSITADVAAVCCGLCLVLVALTLETDSPVFWSGLTGGAVVAALAGYNGYRTRENRTISQDATTRG